jgi:hypothetical protein
MFRSLSGYKAEYQDLTLLVVSEFNEWKVLLYGPHTIINGTRQFSEAKAKEHAVALVRSYFHDRKQEDLADGTELAWAPATADDWLVWS